MYQMSKKSNSSSLRQVEICKTVQLWNSTKLTVQTTRLLWRLTQLYPRFKEEESLIKMFFNHCLRFVISTFFVFLCSVYVTKGILCFSAKIRLFLVKTPMVFYLNLQLFISLTVDFPSFQLLVLFWLSISFKHYFLE